MKDKLTDFDKLVADVQAETEIKQPQLIANDEPVDAIDAPLNTTEKEDFYEAPQIDTELLKSETDFALGLLDAVQSNTFKFGLNYKKKRKLVKLFGEDAINEAEILVDGEKEPQTDKEKSILSIEKNFQNLMAEMPLRDDEKEKLRPILEKYIVQNHGKLPDGFFQMMGLVQIFGGRAFSVIMS